jgi:hypothetical protein
VASFEILFVPPVLEEQLRFEETVQLLVVEELGERGPWQSDGT